MFFCCASSTEVPNDLQRWSLKCIADWSNLLQMEVGIRLCRSHQSRFKQNRSEALFLFLFFLHNYPSGLCSLPKQHEKEQTWENIHEPGSETRTRLHLPFQRSDQKKKKKKLLLFPTSPGRVLLQLLHFSSWFICEGGNFTPFHPRRVFRSQLLHFDLVCISYISLSTFGCFRLRFQFSGLR